MFGYTYGPACFTSGQRNRPLVSEELLFRLVWETPYFIQVVKHVEQGGGRAVARTIIRKCLYELPIIITVFPHYYFWGGTQCVIENLSRVVSGNGHGKNYVFKLFV